MDCVHPADMTMPCRSRTTFTHRRVPQFTQVATCRLGCGLHMGYYTAGSSGGVAWSEQCPAGNYADLDEVPATQEVQPSPKGRKKGKGKQSIKDSSAEGRGPNYSTDEDMVLMSAWLNTSYDPVVGTNQSGDTFWDTISKEFNKLSKRGIHRGPRSVESRWRTINSHVAKFVGIFRAICNRNASGTTYEDRVNEAKEVFKQDVGKDFDMEHCWKVLREEPKWLQIAPLPSSNKKQKSHEAASPADSNNPVFMNSNSDARPARPMGRKQAKSRSTSVASPCDEFFDKWDSRKSGNEDKKLEYYDRIVKAKEDEVELKRKHLEQENFLKQMEYERLVMAVDLDTLSGPQRAYYARRQKDILKKCRADEVSD